jgi:cytochrome o ubiquinol oxidase operon protein cyoD
MDNPYDTPADDANDLAPGSGSLDRGRPRDQVLGYVVGLLVSALLTGAAFWLPHTGLVWPPAIPVALAVLAVAQIGVQLVFFLHLTTAPDNTNNVLALAFGVLIVALIIVGSLWIMASLDRNMMA